MRHRPFFGPLSANPGVGIRAARMGETFLNSRMHSMFIDAYPVLVSQLSALISRTLCWFLTVSQGSTSHRSVVPRLCPRVRYFWSLCSEPFLITNVCPTRKWLCPGATSLGDQQGVFDPATYGEISQNATDSVGTEIV